MLFFGLWGQVLFFAFFIPATSFYAHFFSLKRIRHENRLIFVKKKQKTRPDPKNELIFHHEKL